MVLGAGAAADGPRYSDSERRRVRLGVAGLDAASAVDGFGDVKWVPRPIVRMGVIVDAVELTLERSANENQLKSCGGAGNSTSQLLPWMDVSALIGTD